MISQGGHDFTPSAPKVLQVFSMLALRANKLVPTELLIQEIWGDDPPRSARTTIQTYIYQIRKFLARVGPDLDERLITSVPGYVLHMDEDSIDLHVFESLVDQGRPLYDGRRWGEAAVVFQEALSLWHGCPLSNVKLGPMLDAHVTHLKENYRSVLKMRIHAQMESGVNDDLVAELRSLSLYFPYDEWIHEQLIRVLERSGRRSDAMEAYRYLRSTLNDQLGIDPSPQLERLHMELLGA
ncbi:AfsR/SARP family transcriptional regulator [Nocardiopsis halotolerans]|uniref:AfsR/SARP family transcriptional regulator n=1 Tax=Nocardiopsis halotolerans TaxID=124252 RepID=UPI0003735560|nr:AfsR/SARP family transcriptional regulator [Nocardiopsis halotolerans]